MWGYPLWLFLGLWIVLQGAALDRVRLSASSSVWAIVFAGFAVAFVVNYAVLPRLRRALSRGVLPGDRLGAELSTRFRALTGRPLAYVIGTMWTGGNVAHYAPERPRVLIDGNPRRAPWIDLGDLRGQRRGRGLDRRRSARAAAPVPRPSPDDAEVQAPFTLPYRARQGRGARSAGRCCGRGRRWRHRLQHAAIRPAP